MSSLVRAIPRPKAPLLDGMVRLVSIGKSSAVYRRFGSGIEADLFAIQSDWDALHSDWRMIRNDYQIATKKYIEELPDPRVARID